MFRKLLLGACLLVPSIANAEWHVAGSKHFVVYSDDSEERIRTFTERLERFDQALRYITGTPDKPISPSARVTVFQVADVSAIQKLYGSNTVAGFFQSRSSGSVAFVPRSTSGPLDAQTILLHEYGHNFMYSSWPSVVFPPWFSEGFAEFVGTAVFRSDGTLMLGKNPEYRSFGIDKSNYLSAQELVRTKQGKLDRYQTETLYARGWLLTHYLLMDKKRAVLLGNYIAAINSGKSAEEATKELGDLRTLDGRLNSYYKSATIATIMLPKDVTPPGPVTVRGISAGEAATMPARVLSSRGVDMKSAPGVAELARRLAAPYPNDAGAQNELAEAEFDAKNYEASDAAATRALAADPASVHAMLYKGMAQMELARKAGSTDPARWKEVRSWFLKANKAETEYAEPLILFFDSFAAAKQKPIKSAENGLLYAYMLAPYDPEVRLEAGQLLLEMGEQKAARAAYEPIAYSPHTSPASDFANRILDALDANGTEGALKVISDAAAKAKAGAGDAKKSG